MRQWTSAREAAIIGPDNQIRKKVCIDGLLYSSASWDFVGVRTISSVDYAFTFIFPFPRPHICISIHPIHSSYMIP